MERVIVLTPNRIIQVNELPISMVNVSKINSLKESILDGRVSLLTAEEEFEKEIILDALARTNSVSVSGGGPSGDQPEDPEI